MTFTCAHFDPANDWCVLLKTDCVPGRPGCILRGKSQFIVPVEERIREAEQRRKLRLGLVSPRPRESDTERE